VVELFRFIQQAFVVPVEGASIDLVTNSDFQEELRGLIDGGAPHSAVRARAEEFLNGVIGSVGGLSRGPKYLALRAKLVGLQGTVTSAKVDQAVKDVFGVKASDLVASEAFQTEKRLASDVLVAVKITTRFDVVDAPAIATMRGVIAFVDDFVANRVDPLSPDNIRKLLERPLRVPEIFLPRPSSSGPVAAPRPEDVAARPAALVGEQDALRRAYDLLMSVRPAQLAITGTTPEVRGTENTGRRETAEGHAASERAGAASSVVGVSRDILAAMDPVVLEHLRTELADVETTALTDILDVVKRRWSDVSREVEPGRVPAPARTYRLGMHVFAVREPSVAEVVDEEPVPDFGHAVTRPIGIGDLQVVRQELVGYAPAEISHIENVLPGELLRRTTRREETTELTVTDETETTQSQERDTQSTQRNELATEAQKEASRQSAETQNQTSTSNYGRLVENSKTDYARSVTDRAVNKLTQTVRQQRVQREKKVFTEEALHQVDNSDGNRLIRGLYQWIDKKYRTKLFNYGKRLLYDVVVPEPAAFLIDALKKAAQPETFQLTRPTEPDIQPTELNAVNYTYWAAQYGVSGAVTPPPPEFTTTVAHTDARNVTEKFDAYGATFFAQHVTHFKIRVPDGYSAISGYVQRTNRYYANETPDDPRQFEFFIGENTFLRFGTGHIETLNSSFTLGGESGDIPVTMRTFPETLQFNYAVGINYRRLEKEYEQWQLKTHAQIVAGYHRQRAEYLDQLGRYQAAVRTQMALAHGFSHDTGMERQELKKAFIHLLMSEHPGAVYFPTPSAGGFPMDPHYVKTWGAVVAFFERAFEWEHLMYVYYPYFWGRKAKWGELILIQDLDPEFEAFLKAGAARVVVPVRPGFEAALAHYHETGDVWMGEEIPDMFSERYVSIIAEIKARNANAGEEVFVEEWDVRLPTTLVMVRDDDDLPQFTPTSSRPGPGA
jgi:hypothetical protein